MGKAQLHITDTNGAVIQPNMIGVFFEDINYGADGGLSAELIENRNFEFLDCFGDFDQYHQTADCGYGWAAYPKLDDKIRLGIESQNPASRVNVHYLTIQTTGNHYGVTNQAYDGICLTKGCTYEISFYARANDYQGKIAIQIITKEDVTGQSEMSAKTDVAAQSEMSAKMDVAAKTTVEHIGREWTKYKAVLKAEKTVRHAMFVLTLSEPGTVSFDMISMIPSDAVLGVFRKDLVTLLKEMKPGFMRFPGGCVVEGNELENRYEWKNTVGPALDRKANWNRWAVHGNNTENKFHSKYSHYNQTLAIGFYEYFQLCEYLSAKAIPVVNVGLACQYQSTQLVPSDSEEFLTYLQDALDLVEFANGDVNTAYGSLRAAMGHPKTFDLEYIGIGNEQWNTDHVDYYHRYEVFEKAIHERYPSIKLISSAGPDVLTPRYEDAWKWLHAQAAKNPDFTEAVDEHYYVKPQWCLDHTEFYDKYPRDVKVFAGEYAAHIANGMNHPEYNTLQAALAEAALMTGLQRNSDVVVLACYAPLFARMGYTQWSPDLIWFDDASAYGTPSYYVQKLYSLNLGDQNMTYELKDGGKEVFTAVSYDNSAKEVIIKAVNVTGSMRELQVCVPDWMTMEGQGTLTLLTSENENDSNSIEDPVHVAPVEQNVRLAKAGCLQLAAHSFGVYRFPCRF